MSEGIFNEFQECVWDLKCRPCGIHRIQSGVPWCLQEITIISRVAKREIQEDHVGGCLRQQTCHNDQTTWTEKTLFSNMRPNLEVMRAGASVCRYWLVFQLHLTKGSLWHVLPSKEWQRFTYNCDLWVSKQYSGSQPDCKCNGFSQRRNCCLLIWQEGSIRTWF